MDHYTLESYEIVRKRILEHIERLTTTGKTGSGDVHNIKNWRRFGAAFAWDPEVYLDIMENPNMSDKNLMSALRGREDALMKKLNYVVHMLEEQQDQKTGSVTEEMVLYMFLGVFVIFVVDSFSGHGVGDIGHKDYKIAIDMEENEARPICVMRNAALTEVASTDTARASAGYKKTDDLITQDYTTKERCKQPYATRFENVFGDTAIIGISKNFNVHHFCE